jgi:uncharacterized repeat protein (TIGR01451 family)
MPRFPFAPVWRPLRRGLFTGGATLLLLVLCASTAAGQLSLAGTWEGPFGYVTRATTLRTQSNSGNACAVTSGNTSVAITIPAGTTVEAAYLYWAGSGPVDNSVTFAGSALTADRTSTASYNNGGTVLSFFGAVKDVTSRVPGSGTYTLSGLSVTNTGSHCSSQAVVAGWGLVVIYKQPSAQPRRIQIRDGLIALREGSETINLTGFTGAATPSVQLTYLVYEGDPDQSGDNANPERVYWNGTSLLGNDNNAFNSTVLGTNNVYGVDMDNFTPTLAAGATSATVRMSTGPDLVLPQMIVTSIATAPSYGVEVTPDGLPTPIRRLPGTGYSQVFTVKNTSSLATTYDLIVSGTGTPLFATLDSIRAPGLVSTARPDSARLAIPYGDSARVTFWYSVPQGDTATNTGYLRARAVPQPSVFDDGWAQVRRVRPSLALSKSVNPSSTLSPGTDLTYTLSLSNTGEYDARGVTVTDAVPAQVVFKLGSATQTLPAGITTAVAYSSDGGTTWTYTPVSAGCGAPAGYDACVNRVRWTLSGDLPAGVAASAGTLRFVARIR